MRILLTGANGYVGNCLAALLRDNGLELITTSLTKIKSNKCNFYGSIIDPRFISMLGEKIGKIDAVIHSAALLESNTDSEVIHVNISGTLEVLRLSEILNAKQFYYISTFAMIDLGNKGTISESEKVSTSTNYGMSKFLAEQSINAYRDFSGSTKIFRIPSPIAPNISGDKIFGKFVKNAKLNNDLEIFGNGKRTQNYLDLRDLKNVIVSSLSTNLSGIWNIAGSRLYTDLQLAQNIIEATKSKSKIVFTTKPSYRSQSMREIDTTKVKRDFGYKQEFSMAETILWVSNFVGKKFD